MRTLNFGQYLAEYMTVLRSLNWGEVESIALALLRAWKEGRTVFCCGNGGSAASASHFMMDLAKLTAPVCGPRLRAMALNENVAAISAISNDISYEQIFAEQLRMFLDPNDVVIGFSTSGSSPNVIRAIEYANSAGAVTFGITGRRGHQLEELAQEAIVIDSTSVQQIEDATMVIGHLVCLRVKELIAQESAVLAIQQPAILVESQVAPESAAV
jgi:D-sedoheptulose 7-phosphate isomerase